MGKRAARALTIGHQVSGLSALCAGSLLSKTGSEVRSEAVPRETESVFGARVRNGRKVFANIFIGVEIVDVTTLSPRKCADKADYYKALFVGLSRR